MYVIFILRIHISVGQKGSQRGKTNNLSCTMVKTSLLILIKNSSTKKLKKTTKKMNKLLSAWQSSKRYPHPHGDIWLNICAIEKAKE